MPVPQIMEGIIKVIAGCRVMTVQKTLEVPQFLFSLAKAEKMVDVPVVVHAWCYGQYSSWTRLFLCPLLLRQVRLLGKVVDTPVVCNDRGHGPDSAVLGQGYCCARCFHDRCTWFQTCRKRLEVPQVQFCDAWDVPVTMQRLWWCLWRWGG